MVGRAPPPFGQSGMDIKFSILLISNYFEVYKNMLDLNLDTFTKDISNPRVYDYS